MLRLGASVARRGVVPGRLPQPSTLLRSLSSKGERSHPSESFLSGTSSVYAEKMLAAWQADPSSVHVSWRAYFENIASGVPASGGAFEPPPTIQRGAAPTTSAGSSAVAARSDAMAVSNLIRAYQSHGHKAAAIDPLGQFAPSAFPFRPKTCEELTIEYYGFTTADLDRELVLPVGNAAGFSGFLKELSTGPKTTLRNVVNQLKVTYCGTLAVEYKHISDREKTNWIRDKMEHPSWQKYSKAKKLHLFERLCYADTFETFLAGKFNTTKRFGLDGGEAIIPALKDAIDRGSELGVHSYIFGMPHRGRLNVLANVMRKPMPLLFKEFQGTHYDPSEHIKSDSKWGRSGDVKYHLGTSMDRIYADGRKVHLALVANPSHLECVDPLVVGKARAKQYFGGNRPEDFKSVCPILLHGDAAFAGQGVVYETMQLAGVEDFNVGGTIHVIVNNQIGFTTNPVNSRSTPYCSDLGKAFECPIFHCNGDDPLAVSTALETAIEWRQKWGTDVIVDMICYRRNGHNELDQPHFTQPIMYQKIDKHPTTFKLFEQRLAKEGHLTQTEMDTVKASVLSSYEKDFEASKTYVSKESEWLSSKWKGFKGPNQKSKIKKTGVDLDVIKHVGLTISQVPEGFKMHRQMEKIFKERKETIEKGKGIDWGTAEGLAFGSLLLEGNHVRLTGQDVQRGTFSHRHALVKSQKDEQEYVPLNNLAKNVNPSAPVREHDHAGIEKDTQAGLTVRNSILSEFAVLGFELGYSLENPNALVIWEAQFGDFMNGAQIMIDQFISAGEDKWMRQSGLVMLLPHGYDGMGAEHSSCRVERFLQMIDEDPHFVPPMHAEERMQIQRTNMQVVNCTTPANYFHCLRRQLHRDFRKPLIVVAPKNLLRHRRAVSQIEDFGPETMFHRVFGEQDAAIVANAANVKTLVFCTGQIYYELLEERDKRGLKDIAIVRLEQIAPFAFDRVAENAAIYPNAEVVWAQQEPKNMGAYAYVNPRIQTATKELNNREQRPRYVGRAVSSAPATGMSKVHTYEFNAIIAGVFDHKPTK